RDDASGAQRRGARGALGQGEVAVPDDVEEADLGPGVLRQLQSRGDVEGDDRLVPVVDLHAGDGPDRDTGDAYVIAGLEFAGGGEDRLVPVLGADGEVPHDHGQQAGDQDRDDHEDAELDRGTDGLDVAGAHGRLAWDAPSLIFRCGRFGPAGGFGRP